MHFTLNKCLEVSLNEEDIEKASRIGKNKADKPKKILIQFRKEETKEQIYRKRKILKNNPEGEFYINEDLTPLTAELFHKTRKCVKRKNLKSCWTYRGNIYVKEDETSKPLLIINETALQKYEAFLDISRSIGATRSTESETGLASRD